MRVMHICLSCFFIDEQAYQENELVKAHYKSGHDVMVLASTHVQGADGHYTFAKPGQYRTQEEVPVVRIPYHRMLPNEVGIRLRIHEGVYNHIEAFAPDIILFHGLSSWELLTVARYARNNPDVLFYADNHADFLTAGSNFLSRWLLHYLYYRKILLRALPNIKKVLCISEMTMDYAHRFYGIPSDKLEFFPLGGWPVADDDYARIRGKVRASLNIGEEEIVFLQSGKQYARKYLPEALRQFSKIRNTRFRFFIVGVLMDDIKSETESLIASDSRVEFLGWKSSDALRDLLCAADVYVQPGRQSATMQMSLFCSCAVILEDLQSNRNYVDGNGWLIESPNELGAIFEDISKGEADLFGMCKLSSNYANQNLDYEILSNRLFQ